MKKKYSFDEKKHIHLLDERPLIGVTTVLSVISKPALIQWAANEAVDYVIEQWGSNGLSPSELFSVLGEARTAHRKRKEKAGNVGTLAHDWIERFVKSMMDGGEPIGPSDDETVKKMCDNFVSWASDNSVRFLESEKHVWSEKLWIGGILDMVFELEGKKFIGDIKTSSAIYNEHFFQMAAYELCLEEMGEAGIDGYMVINLKKDGTMECKLAENREINKRAFQSALELYKIINNLV